MRVQLLTDLKYRSVFTAYFSSVAGMELVSDTPDLVVDTAFLKPEPKIVHLREIFPALPIVTNTLCATATTIWHKMGEKARVVGIPMLPHYFDRQPQLEYSVPYRRDSSTHEAPEIFLPFLSLLGKRCERINDSIGGIFPRTLAMIVNEAAFAVQEGVATPQDIDTAMKLGTNYPKGPLAWCDEVGAEAVVAILDALAKENGSERYRVATLLRRYAESGQHFIPTFH